MMQNIQKKHPLEEYAMCCYYMMKELGLSLDEIRRMEIKTFHAILELIDEDVRMQKKAEKQAQSKSKMGKPTMR